MPRHGKDCAKLRPKSVGVQVEALQQSLVCGQNGGKPVASYTAPTTAGQVWANKAKRQTVLRFGKTSKLGYSSGSRDKEGTSGEACHSKPNWLS
jgi:hypothetical protein